MNDNKKYSKEWKKYLVETLKIYAKTLEENAEEIIGDYAFTGDLSIMFTLPTNMRNTELPSIDISKEYFPDYGKMSSIYKTFEEERKKDVEEWIDSE